MMSGAYGPMGAPAAPGVGPGLAGPGLGAEPGLGAGPAAGVGVGGAGPGDISGLIQA